MEQTNTNPNTKHRSRTFLIAMIWMIFVPLSFVAQIWLASLDLEIVVPIANIVTLAGTISTVYIAGNKGKQIAVASGAPKGEAGKNNEDD